MWVIDPKRGFFSVVADAEPGMVQIRARAKHDLKNLAKILPGKRPVILAWPGRDYPFRVIVPRNAWEAACAQMARETTYTNVKDQVTQSQGKARHDVYLRVWSTMISIEHEPREGRRRRRRKGRGATTSTWGAQQRIAAPTPVEDDLLEWAECVDLACRDCGRVFRNADASGEWGEWCPGCGGANVRVADLEDAR